MKKLAFGAFLLISAIGFTACGDSSSGDDDDDDVVLVDGGDDIDGSIADVDGLPPAACNPIAQTGCGPTEKCTYVVEDNTNPDAVLARTKCVPDGTVDIGGACAAAGEVPNLTDNCLAGGLCNNGVCKEICTTAPNSCGEGFACSQYVDTFDDVEGAGVCDPGCEPVSQNCAAETDACYVQFTAPFNASCAGVPASAATQEQDEVGFGPNATQCYLNGCNEGFQCMIAATTEANAPQNVCAAFCTPVDTSQDAPGGAGGLEGSGHTCGDRGANQHDCRFLNSFYNGLDMLSETIGFCVARDVWGSCAEMDPATQMDPNGTVIFGCIKFQAAANVLPYPHGMDMPKGFVLPPLPL